MKLLIIKVGMSVTMLYGFMMIGKLCMQAITYYIKNVAKVGMWAIRLYGFMMTGKVHMYVYNTI